MDGDEPEAIVLGSGKDPSVPVKLCLITIISKIATLTLNFKNTLQLSLCFPTFNSIEFIDKSLDKTD